MNIIRQFALFCCLIVQTPGVVSAEIQSAIGLQQHRISIADSTFNSNAVTARAGLWIEPGIGLEVGLSLPLTKGSVDNVSIGLDALLTAGVRLESPSSTHGFSAFFLSGFASGQIKGDSVAGQSVRSDTYTGPYLGFGLARKFNHKLLLSVDYIQHNLDKSIAIPSFQIGVRYPF